MPRPLTPATLACDPRTVGDPQLSPYGRQVLDALAEVDPATKRQTTRPWRCDIDGSHLDG